MSENPVILLASARKQSDTKKCIGNLFKDTEHLLLDLLDFRVHPFDYSHQYPPDDAFPEIIREVLKHNIIIFATPIYWYAMSGLLKTFFDRLTDLVTIDKPTGRRLKGKSIVVIAVGADEELPPGFEVPFRMTADYLDMTYRGCLYQCTKSIQPDKEMRDRIQSML